MGVYTRSGQIMLVGGGVASQPTQSPIFVDLTALSAQDPLSNGGTWSSNSQGAGGNGPAVGGTDVRIVSGTPNVAVGSIAAQANYEDSFAFIPGVIGGLLSGPNYRVTCSVFVASGYAPVDNHEMEIIIGCKAGGYPSGTTVNYHRWIECLWSLGGSQDTINQDGDFSGTSFQPIGVSTGLLTGGPGNLDKMIAEYYPGSNRIRWGRIRSGTTIWAQDVTNATYINPATLGNGIGIAFFRRAGDTNAVNLGFRDILIESFT